MQSEWQGLRQATQGLVGAATALQKSAETFLATLTRDEGRATLLDSTLDALAKAEARLSEVRQAVNAAEVGVETATRRQAELSAAVAGLEGRKTALEKDVATLSKKAVEVTKLEERATTAETRAATASQELSNLEGALAALKAKHGL